MGNNSDSTSLSAKRQSFYAQIGTRNLAPLWEVLHALVPSSPAALALPAIWRFAEIQPEVLSAGALISAEEAERRVLVLENPALRGQSRITQALYAGLQLILPGEVAPSHRHSQSAFRLVLDGEGAYTAVDGERATMHHGDLIITPSWTWHDHGNPSASPVIWLDGLDIPLVEFLGSGFSERDAAHSRCSKRPEGRSSLRFGQNMVPIDFAQHPSGATRLFVYPYSQTRDVLSTLARTEAVDPHFGHKMRFINPATGASPLPTIGLFAQLVPKGLETRGYRSTEGVVYTCMEGVGVVEIEGRAFDFTANDIFVVPSWCAVRFRAAQDLLLISFSERPVQQALGLWREERLSETDTPKCGSTCL